MRLKEAGKGRVPCIIVNLAAARWMSGSVLLINDQAWGKDSWILLMTKRDLFSWDQSGQFRAARPTREGNQSEQGSCFILMASAQSRITIPHTIIDR